MRAARIQEQISSLSAERHRLRGEGHRKIAEAGKAGDDTIADQAVEHFKQADALTGKIDALNQALESAEVHDREDRKAEFLLQTAEKVKVVIELAEARIKIAAAVDKKFAELRAAMLALANASGGIESQVRAIVSVRDRGLDHLRAGEKVGFVMLHARLDGPAFVEAIAQSVSASILGSNSNPLIEFKSPVGDPARGTCSVAAAADIAAHGLRQRLLSD